MISRYRAQLDWELSPAWFVNAFADRRSVDNLSSPLDGVLNTRADVANLDRLRQRSVANLAAPTNSSDADLLARHRDERRLCRQPRPVAHSGELFRLHQHAIEKHRSGL